GAGDGQDVAQRRAQIPPGVAVGALLVAPGVAPEGAGRHQQRWRFCYRWFSPGSFNNRPSIVARTNPPEAVGVGGVVVDAGGEAGEIASYVVELQVVARASAAGGAVEDLPAGAVAAALEDAV